MKSFRCQHRIPIVNDIQLWNTLVSYSSILSLPFSVLSLSKPDLYLVVCHGFVEHHHLEKLLNVWVAGDRGIKHVTVIERL
jgi:hypothetical protein